MPARLTRGRHVAVYTTRWVIGRPTDELIQKAAENRMAFSTESVLCFGLVAVVNYKRCDNDTRDNNTTYACGANTRQPSDTPSGGQSRRTGCVDRIHRRRHVSAVVRCRSVLGRGISTRAISLLGGRDKDVVSSGVTIYICISWDRFDGVAEKFWISYSRRTYERCPCSTNDVRRKRRKRPGRCGGIANSAENRLRARVVPRERITFPRYTVAAAAAKYNKRTVHEWGRGGAATVTRRSTRVQTVLARGNGVTPPSTRGDVVKNQFARREFRWVFITHTRRAAVRRIFYPRSNRRHFFQIHE